MQLVLTIPPLYTYFYTDLVDVHFHVPPYTVYEDFGSVPVLVEVEGLQALAAITVSFYTSDSSALSEGTVSVKKPDL